MADSLISKLAAVMAAVDRIPKHGRNDFHKYDYATEADIVAAVRQELAKRLVMLIPAVNSRERVPVGDKGSVLTLLGMTFTFYDGESGQSLSFPWSGAGTDKEDKGEYKAMTGAEKYFILKTFLIPTGDDPEAEDAHPQARQNRREPARPAPARPAAAAPPAQAVRLITEAQRTRLYAMANANGWESGDVKAYLKASHGLDSSKEIPVSRYDEICRHIEGVAVTRG